ncbi:MAG: aspartate carbamoyltransferase catalytic subunit [Myxococcales bacterium]|nr:aspartate carbamoyltransferase catalytic subunit [Myxococcales bacterium]
MSFLRKDILGLAELSADEIQIIIDMAETFREVSERDIKKVPALRGRTIVNCFFEPSTRTRMSFEIAGKRLSADTVNISAAISSIQKGETLRDMSLNLAAMRPDVIVLRHPMSGAAHMMAREIDVPVINAGDGSHEHPSQGLLDMLTLRRHFGRLEGLRVAIIGDIAHSRVARSNIHGLTKMGAEVVVGGPRTLVPVGIERMGVKVARGLDEAIKDADAVMMLRLQTERYAEVGLVPSVREYATNWGLTRRRLDAAKPGVIVMHPGPINRGVEIDPDVADGPNSVILEQVTNGIAVRMALLFLVMSAEKKPALN